jgi:predicted secreted protein
MSYGSHTFGAKTWGASGGWPAVVPPEPVELETGNAWLVYVDLNSVGGGGADWQALPQQEVGKVTVTTELLNLETLGDNNWPFYLGIHKHWFVDLAGYLLATDPAWQHILSRAESQQTIFVKIENPGAPNWEGESNLEILDYEFPESGTVAYTVSLQGHGSLSKSIVE